jgi:hypothetical protein
MDLSFREPSGFASASEGSSRRLCETGDCQGVTSFLGGSPEPLEFQRVHYPLLSSATQRAMRAALASNFDLPGCPANDDNVVLGFAGNGPRWHPLVASGWSTSRER